MALIPSIKFDINFQHHRLTMSHRRITLQTEIRRKKTHTQFSETNFMRLFMADNLQFRYNRNCLQFKPKCDNHPITKMEILVAFFVASTQRIT